MHHCAVMCRSAGALVVAIVLAVSVGDSAGRSWADPAADALARMKELSREAERTMEAIYSAELDLDAKLAAQRLAESSRRAQFEVLNAARADLSNFQDIVNQAAAASYMRGGEQRYQLCTGRWLPTAPARRIVSEQVDGHPDVRPYRRFQGGFDPRRERG